MSRWAVVLVLLWIGATQYELLKIQRRVMGHLDDPEKEKELHRLVEEDLRGRVEERKHRLPPLPPVRPS